ncbi:hypothetical protein EAE32_01655 [Kocuria tytonicola]|uniref:Uncharacterized protein n=1 Tax=Kocuria tytonicola TaxID=2055946 RepID=A0A3L9L740_9MICC|nr:hypothetical protein EAE32_01655 [Kocuria tytonicola]
MEHAVELSAGDREDRRIASVIRASRSREWTEGVYQVFLLTRPGDGDQRLRSVHLVWTPCPRPPARPGPARGCGSWWRARCSPSPG